MANLTINQLQSSKRGSKFIMLTAYDYSLAKIIDKAGVDLILVGDSLAMVMLGHENTEQVTMDEMIHHAKAARKGVSSALLIGDMPRVALEDEIAAVVDNARRFIDEAGCDAVKVEWKPGMEKKVRQLVDAQISVMGHVGLTPQTASKEGGFGIRGKDAKGALKVIEQAQCMQDAGCFSVVLECIPDVVAEMITKKLSIPTIGIGSGIHCDGQVLVSHDLLGLYDRFLPRFVKQYVKINPLIEQAINEYVSDVRDSKFPGREHTATMKSAAFEALQKAVGIHR